MQIRYRVTQDVREVDDGIARALIARHLADEVGGCTENSMARVLKVEDAQAVSPRTGKPKRRYKRRDMRAES